MDKKPKKKTQVLAHSRRQRENDTFTDIAQALPIQENAKDLDKASILRLAIHYLKLRDLIKDGGEGEDLEGLEEGEEGTESEEGLGSPEDSLSGDPTALFQSDPNIADFLPNFSKDVVQALDGFLMVISRDGRVLFSSESIANYLGLRQVDVIGVNVQDIIHPQDCSEVIRIFQSQGHDSEQVFDQKEPLRRKFVARMRCAFTPSVRCITRCSNFKPIYCSCFLKFGKNGAHRGQFLGMVVFCKLATLSKIKEMVVGTFFKTKHSLDLSYTNVDTRIRWILGYDPSEMTGLKAYQYFHPQDLGVTSSCHMNLLSRGISHSPCYRFMTRWGDWVWCRSKSQMVFNKNSHLPEGIVIYTWIVRVDEEDDRMLAIKKGEDGEDKRKTYDSFSTNISSSDGVALDVTALADPFGKPREKATPLTPPSVTQSVEAGPEPCSPPLSAQSSPLKLKTTLYSPSAAPQMGMAVSSPPMGVAVSSPPMGVAVSSPPMGVAVSSPPMGVAVSSPPMGVAVSSPPMGVAVSSPPMGVAVSSPPMGVAVSSPPMGVTTPPNSAMTASTMDPFMGRAYSSDIADQAFLFDQAPPTQQNFMPSPPYTPYVHPAPSSGMMNSPPYSNNSPPYSKGTPSPLDSSQIFSNACDDFPPYSSTTPSFDHMVPNSTHMLPQSVNQYIDQQAMSQQAPPMGSPNQGMFGGGRRILSTSGHVTAFGSQSSTPSPSVELRATFIPNGNASSNLSGYSETCSVPMGPDMTNIFALSETEFVQKSIPSLTQAPPHVRQSVIHSARQRYSGAIPTGHAPSSSGGHVTGGRGSGGDGDADSADSISQWSQWLKGSAPAPVC